MFFNINPDRSFQAERSVGVPPRLLDFWGRVQMSVGSLTSPVGDVSADEALLLPPVQQTRAFQQEGRGQHVARDRGQDTHSSTHLLQVCWKGTHETQVFT